MRKTKSLKNARRQKCSHPSTLDALPSYFYLCSVFEELPWSRQPGAPPRIGSLVPVPVNSPTCVARLEPGTLPVLKEKHGSHTQHATAGDANPPPSPKVLGDTAGFKHFTNLENPPRSCEGRNSTCNVFLADNVQVRLTTSSVGIRI